MQELADGWNRLAQEDHMKAIGGTATKFDFERNGLRYARNVADMFPVNPRPVVLEVGCGAARIMKHLAYMCEEIHGVDVSDEMLGHASPMENMGLHLVKDTSLDMFPDEKFDFAYSIGCFIHTPPEMTNEYVQSVKRVLKPGCKFYFDCHALQDSVLMDVNRCIHTPLEWVNKFRDGWNHTDIKFVNTRFICTFVK